MGIDEFDPISQPKKLKSAAKLRKLEDVIVIEAANTVRENNKEITET